MTIRIAMWSGPRAISTAMMRAWENRSDTHVIDEPLYAHYLKATGAGHPGADEVIATCDTSWESVSRELVEISSNEIIYQKHMTHHLLGMIDRTWIDHLINCFLLRSPARMAVSLDRVTPDPTIADTGLSEQLELFQRECDRRGTPPPVVVSADVLGDPRGMLTALCCAIGVPFDEAMLSWPAGPRDSDGAWAPHWYRTVEASTGFGPPRLEETLVPDRLLGIIDQMQELYDQMAVHSLSPVRTEAQDVADL